MNSSLNHVTCSGNKYCQDFSWNSRLHRSSACFCLSAHTHIFLQIPKPFKADSPCHWAPVFFRGWGSVTHSVYFRVHISSALNTHDTACVLTRSELVWPLGGAGEKRQFIMWTKCLAFKSCGENVLPQKQRNILHLSYLCRLVELKFTVHSLFSSDFGLHHLLTESSSSLAAERSTVFSIYGL